MKQLVLIRHSMTAGNLEHRYIGCRTDLPLCSAGIHLAQQRAVQIRSYWPDLLFVSPMRRCTETASILFPEVPQHKISGLRECDFGQFEGKNYQELTGNPEYQAWIDSGGMLPFPDGESRTYFIQRSCAAIERIVQQYSFETAAVVAHGGTFMAVLSALEEHKISYFDWKITYCTPLLCQVTKIFPLRLWCDSRKING